MKIYIDLSIFSTCHGAVGRISGLLNFAVVPFIGSTIVFTNPGNSAIPIVLDGFSGLLKVTDLRFEPSNADASIALSLEDIRVSCIEDARKVMKYLEDGFGLTSDEYYSV